MPLIIKAISGPLKNKEWPLEDGLTIGRAKGDIALEDPKASSEHAIVQKAPDGALWLADLGSKNGIRSGHQRVERLELKLGTQFYIGNTLLGVFEAAELPLPEIPQGLPPPAPTARHWSEIFGKLLKGAVEHVVDKPIALKPFQPALKLQFVRGYQTETNWFLGYGPRKVGAKSLDLKITEPGAPDLCFQVTPAPEGALFETQHPGKITINGQPFKTKILQSGDIIKILQTEIEVDLS